MKNLYLLLLLTVSTVSVSYNVFALEKPEEILGEQKQNIPNYPPYAEATKDINPRDKKVINQAGNIQDKADKSKNRNIWNENKGIKDGKEVEDTKNKNAKNDKEAEGIENKDAKSDKEAEVIENKDLKNDEEVENIENQDTKDAIDAKRLEEKYKDKNNSAKDDKKTEDKKVNRDINGTDNVPVYPEASHEEHDKTATDSLNKRLIPYRQTKQTTRQESKVNRKESMAEEAAGRSRENTDRKALGKSKENNNKLKRWTNLKKEPVKEWPYQETQDKPIHMKQYNDLNSHLPVAVYVRDYNNQLFYCVGKNDTLCIRGIINKLENIGFSINEILDLRNNMGDTSLIYAARKGGLDAVRFLLLQGADVNAVNNKFETALDIAYRQDIVNAISEMRSDSTAVKKISNQQDSNMYNWAMNTKENNEKDCNTK